MVKHFFSHWVIRCFFAALILAIFIYIVAPSITFHTICYDSLGYYIYLPSFFIYHDSIHSAFVSDMIWKYDNTHTFYQALRLPNGNFVFGYTMGVAILQLPFFFIAHFIALLFRLTSDGFSPIYQIAIAWSGIFYGLVGLRYLSFFLNVFFERKIVYLTLFLLILGTNFGYYFLVENGMGHVYSFCLVASNLVWFSAFLKEKKTRYAVCLGLSLGLLLLIRPTNLLVCLPFFFLGLEFRYSALKERLYYFFQTPFLMLQMGVLVSIPFLLQMCYWKYSTGHFLFNPYSFAGLGFDFLHPHILFGLFSLHRGAFFYSPVLLISLVGVVFYTRSLSISRIILGLFFLINLWVVFSWRVIDYGASYGARALIDSYPLLMFFFTSGISFLFYNNRLLRSLFFIACFLGCSLNLLQTWKFTNKLFYGYNTVSIFTSYFKISDSSPSANEERILQESKATEIKKWNLSIPKNKFDVVVRPDFKFNLDSLSNFMDTSSSTFILETEAVSRYKKLDIFFGKRPVSLVVSQSSQGKIYVWQEKDIYAQEGINDSMFTKTIMRYKVQKRVKRDDKVSFFISYKSDGIIEFKSIEARLYEISPIE